LALPALRAQYAEQGLQNGTVSVPLSVRLSVPARVHSNEPAAAAAGLLLWARLAGDIDRLQQHRRAAGECGQCHVVSVRTCIGN